MLQNSVLLMWLLASFYVVVPPMASHNLGIVSALIESCGGTVKVKRGVTGYPAPFERKNWIG